MIDDVHVLLEIQAERQTAPEHQAAWSECCEILEQVTHQLRQLTAAPVDDQRLAAHQARVVMQSTLKEMASL
jgi:ferric-dicitrate binding protein FerR (iron transport regulator)